MSLLNITSPSESPHSKQQNADLEASGKHVRVSSFALEKASTAWEGPGVNLVMDNV